ncbi:Mce family protein [Gordonia araii NBRC 100433]|uniref:Mce family protein n=1 Tax=Gordonia araii NBRC 100433 TaxID=1073574 RepID=G7H1J7_9ACTN|nr:MCE family protein [Gordonia araii]NNG97769.1 MCE family protein [Gordonia araii NBRC 100433]GAB09722.1 Mce family protein [Gordonia araii NBRC 100433]
MVRREERSVAVRRTAAVVMVGALTLLIAGASGQFLGWFKSTVPVTVVAPRAGLVMNPDAKVKLRGVEVGRVESISEENGRAVLRLAISADQVSGIPGNVTADIKSNTIFGAKAVTLVAPSEGPAGRLQAGAQIDGENVTVELNTVYQRLVNVLAQLQPDKLNAAVGAITTALDGNGDAIGRGIDSLSKLLGKTNPHLDELTELINETSATMNLYADAMPNLMRTVDNAVFLGNTLVQNTANLDALLVNATGMAGTISGVIEPKKAQIIAMLNDSNPTMALLGYNAPGIACFIRTAAVGGKIGAPIFGLHDGLLKLNAGLLPGKDPYQYPRDLPWVRGAAPPTCENGLSNPRTKTKANFLVIDNAPRPYQPRTQPKVSTTKVFQLLFGAPPRG